MTASSGDHGDELDVEAAWAQIVANWDADADQLRIEQANLDVRGGAHPVARPTTPESRHQGETRPDSGTAHGFAGPEPMAGQFEGDDAFPNGQRGGRHIAEPTVDPDPTVEPVALPAPSDSGGHEDSDSHFVPELDDSSPLLTSWVSRVGWGCLVGAPVFFLFTAIFWRDAPGWVLVLAAGALLLGFALLVISLPSRSADDEGPDDDGAVV